MNMRKIKFVKVLESEEYKLSSNERIISTDFDVMKSMDEDREEVRIYTLLLVLEIDED